MVLIYSLGVGGLGTLGPSGFLRFSMSFVYMPFLSLGQIWPDSQILSLGHP